MESRLLSLLALYLYFTAKNATRMMTDASRRMMNSRAPATEKKTVLETTNPAEFTEISVE